jgi:cytochrome c oxidase subunit 2
MKIHTYEKAFLVVGVGVLLACGAALVYASTIGIHLPGKAGLIDPAQVAHTAPFDKPGVFQTGPNTYNAVVVAQAWTFRPNELHVPVGAEITFIATSTDVIHGFNVERTRLNMMLIPGQISKNTYTFSEPGERLLICHEYCGLGHHTMAGKIIVEDAATFTAPSAAPMPDADAQHNH